MARAKSLVRLLYVSRNTITGPLDALHAEIDRILSVAQLRNFERNVSGLLIFNQGYFAQVLEGASHDVEEIYELIQSDPRHDDVVLLEFEQVEARVFANWSMGFVGADSSALQTFSDMPVSPEQTQRNDRAEQIMGFMQDLALRNEVGLRAA